MFTAEFGCLDGFLHRHIEQYAVKEKLTLPLILLITTHAAEHHPWAIVFKGQGWTDGCAWSLKGSYYVRVMFWFKIKSHQAVAKRKSKRRYNLC